MWKNRSYLLSADMWTPSFSGVPVHFIPPTASSSLGHLKDRVLGSYLGFPPGCLRKHFSAKTNYTLLQSKRFCFNAQFVPFVLLFSSLSVEIFIWSHLTQSLVPWKLSFFWQVTFRPSISNVESVIPLSLLVLLVKNSIRSLEAKICALKLYFRLFHEIAGKITPEIQLLWKIIP